MRMHHQTSVELSIQDIFEYCVFDEEDDAVDSRKDGGEPSDALMYISKNGVRFKEYFLYVGELPSNHIFWSPRIPVIFLFLFLLPFIKFNIAIISFLF